jgi:DNA-binding SARP family transcriptional activator
MATESPAPATQVLAIRLLGPVDVQVGGRPLAVDTRKAVALLAYLALTGRPASRETLGALLWPESGDAEARGALRRTLSVLNTAIGGVGLRIDRTSVALDPAAIDLDVTRFHEAVARARGHGHDPDRSCAACRAALEAAIALDRGGLMEGFSLRDSEPWDEWLEIEREAHQRELAGALERLVRERLAAGGWDGAIAAARRWLELDPLHEPAHRALMGAYGRSGETAAAVRQYRDAASILDRELGVAPLPETTELYEAIVAGTLAPPTTSGSTVRPDSGAIDPLTHGRPSGRYPTPLIGRRGAVDAILGRLAEATPDGRLIVIEGEAGIGKTRLADEVAERAVVLGHRVVAARCYPGEAAVALAPIASLLRGVLAGPAGPAAFGRLAARDRQTLSALVPEIEPDDIARRRPGDAGPAARFRLFDAIAEALSLAGLGGPGDPEPGLAAMVRLDDLQWADDSTLEVLAFLARRLEGRPILLLLSWRREELGERAEALVATADSAPATTVRLDRFGAADMRQLIEALVEASGTTPSPADMEALLDEAEGLPLYAVEALAAPDRAAGTVPVGIRALLQARLAALSEVAVQVVSAAAVLGRSFDAEAARVVSGRSEEETVAALEELERRRIIRGADAPLGSYDFAHARLRDVAYETTSLARRRLLHRRAADVYRRSVGRAMDPLGRLARIATHEHAAGRAAEAAVAYRDAGEAARSLYANREALEYLETALALGHPDGAGLHEAIGDVRTRMGDYRGAIAALEAAAASAEPEGLADIEQRLGRIHLRRGDPIRAEAHLASALAMLGQAGITDDARRSRILAERAVAAARADRREQAARIAGEARDLATGDPQAEAEADRILGLLARDRGDLDAARSLLEQSLTTAVGLPDPAASIAATNAFALVVAEQGDIDLAIILAESARFSARRAGERHLEAAVENNLADMLRTAGRDDEAMDHLRAAVSAFADIGGTPGELEPGIWMLETW